MMRARVREWSQRRCAAAIGVLAITATLSGLAGCSSAADAGVPDSTPTSAPGATGRPVPATTSDPITPATAEAIGLDAPHSGDVQAEATCPDGTEMLDWDGDGWGDCVAPGAPPTIVNP